MKEDFKTTSEVAEANGDSAGARFRIKVCMKQFFTDERANAYVCVREHHHVRWLHRRLRSLFSLPPRFVLLSRGHLLPPDEPLAVLERDDIVDVIPARGEVYSNHRTIGDDGDMVCHVSSAPESGIGDSGTSLTEHDSSNNLANLQLDIVDAPVSVDPLEEDAELKERKRRALAILEQYCDEPEDARYANDRSVKVARYEQDNRHAEDVRHTENASHKENTVHTEDARHIDDVCYTETARCIQEAGCTKNARITEDARNTEDARITEDARNIEDARNTEDVSLTNEETQAEDASYEVDTSRAGGGQRTRPRRRRVRRRRRVVPLENDTTENNVVQNQIPLDSKDSLSIRFSSNSSLEVPESDPTRDSTVLRNGCQTTRAPRVIRPLGKDISS